MHWLLLLAILSSSTNLKNGGSTTNMNRLAENALRQQLGGSSAVRQVRVNVTPGKGRGDFSAFNVTLDGFSADRLMNLANRTDQSSDDGYYDDGSYGDTDSGYGDRYPTDSGYDNLNQRRNLQVKNFKLGDILKDGNIGDVLGGVLGSGGAGRIGKIRLRATNFSFNGARYDAMDASLGEVRFDWLKALRGDFDIKSIQPGNLSVQLRADQAVKLIAPRMPSIRNLSLRFANGRAIIGGRAGMYGVNLPFEVGGTLSVQQNEVRANNISASVAKLRLPGFVMNELTRGVNPLYDFDPNDRWPLAVNLNTAGTPNNALALRGGIQWLGFNRQRTTQRDREEPQRTQRNSQGFPDVLGDILGN